MITDAGIIAAGLGERLQASRPNVPKPLIEVGGRPLVGWVAAGLRCAGIKRVTLLHNSKGSAVREYLKGAFPDIAWTFLRADTKTSWETFRIVASAVAQRADNFLISTVDAIVAPDDTARFTREAFTPWPDGTLPHAALAVTSHVDDEKPLWADLSDDGRTTAIGETAAIRNKVTCGLYGMTREAADELPTLPDFDRLREYWIDLLDRDRVVRGVELKTTLDIDRPSDLAAAEDYLSRNAGRFACVLTKDAKGTAS